MISRDCDGWSQMKACSKRYRKVAKGEKVYCPNGTAHLVDEYSKFDITTLPEHFIEA